MKLMLITGANSQIGSYLAKTYRDAGYTLVLFYHKRKERLTEFSSDSQSLVLPVDLCCLDSMAVALKVCRERFGQYPSILVHCAALRSSDASALSETDPGTFMNVFNVNFSAAYYVLRCILPVMQEQKYGRIIIFGSNVTRGGLKNGSAYAAAKAAIVSLVKSVALEVAQDNILINAISPAPVETNLEEDYQGAYLEFRRNYFAKHIKDSPVGKLVSLKEIRRVVDLLCSEDLQSITGEEIMLRGGLL